MVGDDRPLGRRRMARVALGTAAAWGVLRLVSRSLRRVVGTSMAPTFLPGDVLLVAPLRRLPPVGTPVTVRDPRDARRETVKRLVAHPGEWADLAGEVRRVPPGHVAVHGEAAHRSTDSRRYGAVPIDRLTGRVLTRVWPLAPRR